MGAGDRMQRMQGKPYIYRTHDEERRLTEVRFDFHSKIYKLETCSPLSSKVECRQLATYFVRAIFGYTEIVRHIYVLEPIILC